MLVGTYVSLCLKNGHGTRDESDPRAAPARNPAPDLGPGTTGRTNRLALCGHASCDFAAPAGAQGGRAGERTPGWYAPPLSRQTRHRCRSAAGPGGILARGPATPRAGRRSCGAPEAEPTPAATRPDPGVRGFPPARR